MRIEVTSAGGLEVKDFTFKDGRLSLTPQFYGNGASANALVIQTFTDDGAAVGLTVLSVSGVSGKLKVLDRTLPVQSQLERKKKPAVKPEEKKEK